MTYKELKSSIKWLNEGGKFVFEYNEKKYEFRCYAEYNGKKSFSVSQHDRFIGQTMNVDKVTSQYITVYDYNLFNQRSTFKIPLPEITLVNTKVLEQA